LQWEYPRYGVEIPVAFKLHGRLPVWQSVGKTHLVIASGHELVHRAADHALRRQNLFSYRRARTMAKGHQDETLKESIKEVMRPGERVIFSELVRRIKFKGT
jgi:hypothetical protein